MPTFFHTSVKALSSEGWITDTELGFVRPQLLSQKLKAKWIRAPVWAPEMNKVPFSVSSVYQNRVIHASEKEKRNTKSQYIKCEQSCLSFSLSHPFLSFLLIFVYPPLAQPPFNGVCFYWCSRGKQGIVWTGSGLRSADRSGGWLRAVLELPASSLF